MDRLNVQDIRIRLDFSLIITLVILEWYLTAVFIPSHFPNLSFINQLAIAVAVNAILAVSLIIHEFGHLVVASIVGFKIRQTVLFIFGGVHEIAIPEANEDKIFQNKLKVAMAGPLASALLASLFALTLLLEFQEIDPKEVFVVKQGLSVIFVYAAMGNGLLALVNIIPAVPLDGAEILSSINHKLRKDFLNPTTQFRIAFLASLGFLIAGSFAIFSVSFYVGLLLILLAWILRSGLREYTTLNNLPPHKFT
jgi:Zn-dependent protease